MNQAKDSLEKSMVTDLETGESIESEYRTSTGAFLNKAQVHVLYLFSMLQFHFQNFISVETFVNLY